MKLEKIEENLNWSHEELNQKEIYYISYYNSYFKNRLGYNMTRGGDGLDPETAKTMMIEWHTNASKQQKFSRSINCSIGQQTRYKNSSDSLETIEKKRKSHQGHYIIISPDGERYKATEGLKEFAETYREKLNISYWQLFNAYRKTYSNQLTKQHRKNLNKWKVCRIDK